MKRKKPHPERKTDGSKNNASKEFFTKQNFIKLALSIVLLTVIIAAMIVLNRPDPDAVMTSARKQQYVTAKVTAVLYDDAEPDYIRYEGRLLGKQELEILITQGEHKGETLTMTNYLSALGNVHAKVGTQIIVRMAYNDDGSYYPMMHNYNRGVVLGGLILIFMTLLAIIGGKKGITTLLGLIFTLACLWLILIPMLIKGYSPILITIIIVALTAAVSLILLDGFTKKSLSAILGSIAGVSVAGFSAALVGIVTPLNGFNMSEAEDLILRANGRGLTISGLLVCGILISSLGAVMDVAMSIASAISELHDVNPELPTHRLFTSGMNIGRDALGATANTLILAFVGSSLNVLILVRLFDIPFLQLINTDFIVIEILQGVVGTLGIILTVPFVAYFAAHIVNRAPSSTLRNTKK